MTRDYRISLFLFKQLKFADRTRRPWAARRSIGKKLTAYFGKW